MAYFKKGDIVTAREDLRNSSGDYCMDGGKHGIGVNFIMEELAGKKVKIIRVGPRYSIDADGGQYAWTDEMFDEYLDHTIYGGDRDYELPSEEDLLAFAIG
jgi:hypothetical protein